MCKVHKLPNKYNGVYTKKASPKQWVSKEAEDLQGGARGIKGISETP